MTHCALMILRQAAMLQTYALLVLVHARTSHWVRFQLVQNIELNRVRCSQKCVIISGCCWLYPEAPVHFESDRA